MAEGSKQMLQSGHQHQGGGEAGNLPCHEAKMQRSKRGFVYSWIATSILCGRGRVRLHCPRSK